MHPREDVRCRVGFVGTGGVAARHARILGGFDDVELIAATDVDAGRAADFGRTHGAAPVADVPALLDRGVDAVYVCVPPFAHGELERELAAAGVALFIEKPLGCDVGAAETVGAVLAEARVVARVGHHWRCGEPVRRARELLADRPVRVVRGSWLDKVPPVPWWVDARRSGGQVVEQAVHVLDLARTLVGEVQEVYAVAGPCRAAEPEERTVDGATAAVLRFADGAVGTLDATCRLGWKHRAGLEIVTDDLVLDVTEEGVTARDGDGFRHFPADPDVAKAAADRAFVDAVRRAADVDGLPDYAEALRTHRLACAVARSVASGRPEGV
ncbi:Gfo/Idh/MocA family protein [Pseudonocardia nigra]|uniref:Gfo/Idh/MocA family protein n=1 Tax=Pseudonocardia nigra TaxID=1921578 RepID=UPI001C5E6BE9|nr:Gfo/Idh/MocA family oxidoreductase [Pseudonocardia nigra]